MFSAHKKIAAVVLSLSFFSITPLVYADEPETPIEPTPETATIAIRDGAALLGPFTVTLPDIASTTDLTATGSSETHTIPARSVLALVHALDAENADFEITDLQYFSSFSSFIINCISVPSASASPECYNWTYAVDGAFPFFGMDSYVVENGDAVYLFFGSQWQITTDKTEVETNEIFTVTAETYDPVSGTYLPAEGQTAGAVQFDSFFMATEFATSTTDTLGQALLSLSATGTYSVGVSASGYFPNVSVTVVEPEVVPEEPTQSGGSSGGGGITHISFNTPSALAFLASQQKEDGSFSSSLITDWVAIAYGAVDGGSAEARLKTYLQSAKPSLSSVTDYERHAMALLALGINPYTDTGVDYIAPIITAFDGTQIGSSSLVNDDIFAVFPLLKAGYSSSDSMMQSIASFIISKQKQNGSWEDSVDVTSAGIQALKLLPNTSEQLAKARAYLLTKQNPNGGFGDVFATSWTMQAIASLNETPAQWTTSSGYYPEDYLYTEQVVADGCALPLTQSADMRAWATAYAIPGAEERTWESLLSSFGKPAVGNTGGGQVLGASTTTEPVATTTTAATATTTPALPEEPKGPEEEEVTPPVEEKKIVATKPKETPVPVVATTSEKKATTSTQTASATESGWSIFTSFLKGLWKGLFGFFR